MMIRTPAPVEVPGSGFYALPVRVYARDPIFTSSAQAAEEKVLFDPAFADRQMVFIAEDHGQVRARCVARRSGVSGTGTIGFFEAFHDVAACGQLLTAAEDWLRSHGVRRVLGPMDGDTWHRYRFAVGSLREAPFLKEPWNPVYYPELWEACGYRVIDRYFSARIPDPEKAVANLMPYLRRIRRQGYTFRPIDKRRLTEEVGLMHRLSLQIFSGNRHYTAIGLESFLRLYEGIQSILVPGLCQFCCAPDGAEVGFVFGYPDYADAVRAMRGRHSWSAKLKFLWNRRGVDRVCFKSLGCLPAYRGTSVGPALMATALEQVVAGGYKEVLMCLMHEHNDSRRLDAGTSVPFREYVLYEKCLSGGPDQHE